MSVSYPIGEGPSPLQKEAVSNLKRSEPFLKP